MSNLLNDYFLSVFTEERPFEAANELKIAHNIDYINFGIKEIMR